MIKWQSSSRFYESFIVATQHMGKSPFWSLHYEHGVCTTRSHRANSELTEELKRSAKQNSQRNYCLHPWKLTCPLKSDHFSREYIFQPSFFRGYVSFQGGNSAGSRGKITLQFPKLFSDIHRGEITPCMAIGLNAQLGHDAWAKVNQTSSPQMVVSLMVMNTMVESESEKRSKLASFISRIVGYTPIPAYSLWEIPIFSPNYWVFMGYNSQESLENTRNTMSLEVHPIVP